MLNADKYIVRLRVIVKNEEKYYKSFFINRIKDVIKDYDNDFDKAMEEMEKETSS